MPAILTMNIAETLTAADRERKMSVKIPDELFERIRAGISDAEARIAALESALQPFALLAEQYDAADQKRAQNYKDEGRAPGPGTSDGHRISIGLGDCRKARNVLRADG